MSTFIKLGPGATLDGVTAVGNVVLAKDFISAGEGASLKNLNLQNNQHIAPIEQLRSELIQRLGVPSELSIDDLRECLTSLKTAQAASQEERVEVVKQSAIWPYIEKLDTALSIASSIASLAPGVLATLT